MGLFYKPQNRAVLNQPVILGAKHWELSPRAVIYNLLLRTHREGFNKEELYTTYNFTAKRT